MASCVGEYTLEEFRVAIEQAAVADDFTPGMKVLVDGRGATTALSREDFRRRAESLAQLATAGTPLRVALLTTEARVPVALRSLNVLAEHRIQACAFTDYATAVAWLGTMAEC